jgi:hypothetical protein
VRGFRRYGVTVDKVADLSEDALLWHPPERSLPPIDCLAFENLKPPSKPGWWPEQKEVERRAHVLGNYVCDPMHRGCFGLVAAGGTSANRIDPPIIESIRTLRRVTPDGTVNYDLVAEVTQRRRLSPKKWMYGGATIIIGDDGGIRYSICKHVDSARREKKFRAHLLLTTELRQQFFDDTPPAMKLLMKKLHARRLGVS